MRWTKPVQRPACRSSRLWLNEPKLRLVKKHLGVGSETVEGLLAARNEDDEIQLLEELQTDGSELSEMAQEASVVRLVNEILVEAVDSRASDVHVESQRRGPGEIAIASTAFCIPNQSHPKSTASKQRLSAA